MPLNVGDGFSETIVIPAALYNASGNSGILSDYGLVTALRAQLVITAKAGTNPTLDVVIEDTLDGTNWSNLGSFTQHTDVAVEAVSIIAPVADRLRVRYTIGGTNSPSFTFGVIWIVK